MKDLSEYNDTTMCLPCRTIKRQYFNNRNKNSEHIRIYNRLRTRTYNALNGKTKADTTEELLGCTIEKCIEWLNYQLKIRYNIEEKDINIKYDIDHFIPCASFDLENEETQRECFHWSNLQYLTSKENNKKKDKIPTQKEIDERRKLLAKFIESK